MKKNKITPLLILGSILVFLILITSIFFFGLIKGTYIPSGITSTACGQSISCDLGYKLSVAKQCPSSDMTNTGTDCVTSRGTHYSYDCYYSCVEDNLISACPYNCCQGQLRYTDKLCSSGQICSNNACVTPTITKCVVGTPGNTATRDLSVGEKVCAKGGISITQCLADGTMMNVNTCDSGKTCVPGTVNPTCASTEPIYSNCANGEITTKCYCAGVLHNVLATGDKSYCCNNVYKGTTTCSTPVTPPSCIPKIECGDWNACEQGTQMRDCEDVNSCGTEIEELTEQVCEVPPTEEGYYISSNKCIKTTNSTLIKYSTKAECVKELPTCTEDEIETCEDKSEVTIYECTDGKLVSTGKSCPTELICSEEEYKIGEECVPKSYIYGGIGGAVGLLLLLFLFLILMRSRPKRKR